MSAIALSKECGVRTRSGGHWEHLPGCDIDRSLTPQQRYERRNPERAAKHARRQLIVRRWAVLNGRCGTCVVAMARPGLKSCANCAEQQAEAYRRRAEAPRAEAA